MALSHQLTNGRGTWNQMDKFNELRIFTHVIKYSTKKTYLQQKSQHSITHHEERYNDEGGINNAEEERQRMVPATTMQLAAMKIGIKKILNRKVSEMVRKTESRTLVSVQARHWQITEKIVVFRNHIPIFMYFWSVNNSEKSCPIYIFVTMNEIFQIYASPREIFTKYLGRYRFSSRGRTWNLKIVSWDDSNSVDFIYLTSVRKKMSPKNNRRASKKMSAVDKIS